MLLSNFGEKRWGLSEEQIARLVMPKLAGTTTFDQWRSPWNIDGNVKKKRHPTVQ